MSFSNGLLAGYRVGSGILDRRDRLKQQAINNSVIERGLQIQEAQEGRIQQQFEFGNNLQQLEGLHSELDTTVDLNQFATTSQQSGRTSAIINAAKQTPTQDLDGVFKDKNGSTAASTVMKDSTALQQAIDPTGNWKFNGIFPVKTGKDAGGYVLALQDGDGNQSMLTQDRGSNEGTPQVFSTEHLSMFMADAMRETGELNDPKNIQMMEEAGIDVAGTIAALDGSNPIESIPKRASLENVKRVALGSDRKPKGKQLNDGTVVQKKPVSGFSEGELSRAMDAHTKRQGGTAPELARIREQAASLGDITVEQEAPPASELGAEPLGEGFQENLRAFAREAKQGQRTAQEEAIARDKEFFSNIFDPAVSAATGAVSDATGSIVDAVTPSQEVQDFVSNDLGRTGDVLRRTVSDEGRGIATEFGEEFSEELDATADILTRPAQVAIKTGKAVAGFLFGQSKAEDKKITEDLSSNDPAKTEQAQDKISEDIKTSTPEQRTTTGAHDVKEASKVISTSTTNRPPTPRQKAIATRLYYNGLLPQQSYSTYLQTGRFSFADVAAAQQENRTRQAALKNQLDYKKFAKEVGDDNAKAAKAAFENVANSLSNSVERAMVNSSAWQSIGEEVDLTKHSQNLINTVLQDPRIHKALGIKNQFGFNNAHSEQFARFFAEEGINYLRPPSSGKWFSRDKPADVANANQMINGFRKWQSQK